MLTAELTDADLALWVARAAKVKTPGGRPLYASSGCLYVETPWGGGEPFSYRPDCRWGDGGPLIDLHDIPVRRSAIPGEFVAEIWKDGEAGASSLWLGVGPTRLVAAMRALVASVYGAEVPA